jgi:hypothetical protein
MPVDYIQYFKSLVERDPLAERWDVWWEAHEREMTTLVPRGIYLALTAPSDEQHYRAVFAALEAAGFRYPRPKHYCHPKFRDPARVPAASLQRKISLAELEKESLPREVRDNDLVAIKERLRPGDEIWTFVSKSPHHSSVGFAFVRSGVPYDSITTRSMNITSVESFNRFMEEGQ